MIRIDAVWLAVSPIDMRTGVDRLLASVVQLERRNPNVAAVALANKNARIVWALLVRHGGRLAKNAATWSRLNYFFKAVWPHSSTAWIWNTFFARSIPTVVIFMMDAPLGSSGC